MASLAKFYGCPARRCSLPHPSPSLLSVLKKGSGSRGWAEHLRLFLGFKRGLTQFLIWWSLVKETTLKEMVSVQLCLLFYPYLLSCLQEPLALVSLLAKLGKVLIGCCISRGCRFRSCRFSLSWIKILCAVVLDYNTKEIQLGDFNTHDQCRVNCCFRAVESKRCGLLPCCHFRAIFVCYSQDIIANMKTDSLNFLWSASLGTYYLAAYLVNACGPLCANSKELESASGAVMAGYLWLFCFFGLKEGTPLDDESLV